MAILLMRKLKFRDIITYPRLHRIIPEQSNKHSFSSPPEDKQVKLLIEMWYRLGWGGGGGGTGEKD